MQLDIFNDSSTLNNLRTKDKISWSYSKMGTLKQCPRRFYYQYYGSKKRAAKEEDNKERLQFLSSLSNKNLVPGEIVHSIIAIYFRKYKQGERWTLERLQNFAGHMLDQSISYSIEKSRGIENTRKFPPSIFKELYYSSIKEDILREEVRNKINNNIKNFYSSPLFEHLRRGGIIHNSIIEGKANFGLNDLLKVDGVIDISFEENDKLTIADWKTGKSEVEETSLQLLTYALWAIQKRKANPENIVIEKAYLIEDKIEPLEFSSIHLERAQARIKQDVEVLRELDDFGKNSICEAFTKCEQKKICDQCPFQEICEK